MSEVFWHLEERGMREVLVFITDESARDGRGRALNFPRGGLAKLAVHSVRNTPAKVRKGGAAGVLGDMRRMYTAENPEKAQAAWAEFQQCGEGCTLRSGSSGRCSRGEGTGSSVSPPRNGGKTPLSRV
ncbi:MAG: transposase [Candidatus Hadarchaeum sp.]